jgi:hypothetical protein
MAAITCWSLSEETKVIARPFVPNRPARLWQGKRQKEVRRMNIMRHPPNTMQVAVRIGRAVVVDNDVDSFNIDTTTKDVRSNENTFLECLEGCITIDAVQYQDWVTGLKKYMTYRSSCCSPEWMLMLGKLQDTSNLSNSMARATDFTKITT